MVSTSRHGDLPDGYDPRKNPQRGVRVKPLPRATHGVFTAFMLEYRCLVQSHISTWALANREMMGTAVVESNLIYWRSVLRSLDHIIYLATQNDPSKRRGPDPDFGA
jgi:hypothetical protein